MGIFFVLFSKIKIEEVIGVLGHVKPALFFLAVFISIANNIFLSSDKWRRILHVFGRDITLKEAIFMKMGSDPIISILPMRAGELTRVVYLRQWHNFSFLKGFSSIFFELGLNFLAVLFFISVGHLILNFSLISIISYICFLSLILFITRKILFKLRMKEELINSIRGSRINIYNYLREIIYVYNKIGNRRLLTLFIYSTVFIASELANFYILSEGLDLSIPYPLVFIFIPLTTVITSLPITLFGLGTREAAIIFFFSKYGSLKQLLSLGILYSSVEYLLPVVISLVYTKPFIDRLVTTKEDFGNLT